MGAWWNALQPLSQVYYAIAIPATVILLIQTVLLLFGLGSGGGDADHDIGGADHDFDHDADHDTGHEAGHDAGAHDLRIFTVRGIIAFLAIGGWAGVATIDLGVPQLLTVFISVLAGLAAMLLVAWVISQALKLQQSGNLDFDNAVGLLAQVYVPIEAGGKGKVTLIVQDRFVDWDATCKVALKTGASVRVVGVENQVLIVEPTNESAPTRKKPAAAKAAAETPPQAEEKK